VQEEAVVRPDQIVGKLAKPDKIVFKWLSLMRLSASGYRPENG
jgi:hypothetical protein